jgi:hypothetical protein
MHSRRYPRYHIDRPVKATVFWDDHPIRKVLGRAITLSEGGLGASLADQLYLGEVVRLEMPPVPPIYATVRNTRGTEHGFEFLYSRDGQRQAVQVVCAAAAEASLGKEAVMGD